MELECILISKDNQQIKCKYYELDRICQGIIQNETKNFYVQKKFIEFSQKYSYFTPFFDFVLQELGYKLINAFGVQNAVMYAVNNQIHWAHGNQDYVLFSTFDDEHIGLEKMSKENLKLCMLDENLYGIAPKNMGHELVSRLILHNYFLYDKELFQKYVEDSQGNFYFFNHTNFLMENKSFLRLEVNHKNEKNQHFVAFKNRDINYEVQGYKENLSQEQDTFIKELKENGIFMEIDIHLNSKLESDCNYAK